ncbi:hypothetical protein H744_2c2170 [Photobacterium gaetbulicola Gung47]|uniref:Retropepsin-like aspartic endopeptidase domain-containing protein n=1 Tax=Photobacterium gaetbulicola Gung47 TaxID=658445 RepID=A0A0C5WUU6_9GAMM|nr:RimK/LysX family protein [Photobacterium gaetbulicola]AJR08834.1 hypothetical protein H744_2c2170 [Photobacterium gaetbulicola Gung47]
MLINERSGVGVLVFALLFAASPTIAASDYAQECGVEAADKVVIGQKESFYAPAANLIFRFRIDTGATRTSMHATNIEIENFSPEAGDNIGKMVNFITANEHGETVHMREKITHVRQIQNSLGSEMRYSIELDLTLAERDYRVEVNLKDRSLMSDKLLIGRNLLACNYVVDVSIHSTYGV